MISPVIRVGPIHVWCCTCGQRLGYSGRIDATGIDTDAVLAAVATHQHHVPAEQLVPA